MVIPLSEARLHTLESGEHNVPWTTEFSIDRINVGDKLGPVSHLVDEVTMSRYGKAMGVERPLYPTRPARILSHLAMQALIAVQKNPIPGAAPPAANAREMVELCHPAKVGDILVTEGTIIAKYERRGKPYVVGQGTTTNQDGVVIERTRKTWILTRTKIAAKWDFLQKPGDAVHKDPGIAVIREEEREQSTIVRKQVRDIKLSMNASDVSVGDRVAQMTIDYTWDHITAYEGVLPKVYNMHNSYEAAALSGFSQPFASGTMLVAHLVENLLPAPFGAGWSHHGSLNMVNTRPITVDSKVLLVADVVAKLPQGDNTLVVMKVTGALPDGTEVAVGTAGALARN